MPNLCVGEANIPVTEFTASDFGRDWLERRPDLVESLASFAMSAAANIIAKRQAIDNSPALEPVQQV